MHRIRASFSTLLKVDFSLSYLRINFSSPNCLNGREVLHRVCVWPLENSVDGLESITFLQCCAQRPDVSRSALDIFTTVTIGTGNSM